MNGIKGLPPPCNPPPCCLRGEQAGKRHIACAIECSRPHTISGAGGGGWGWVGGGGVGVGGIKIVELILKSLL